MVAARRTGFFSRAANAPVQRARSRQDLGWWVPADGFGSVLATSCSGVVSLPTTAQPEVRPGSSSRSEVNVTPAQGECRMAASRAMILVARIPLAALLAFAACAGAPTPTAPAAPIAVPAPAAAAPATPAERWKTIFADEFDGPDGSLPDRSKWGFDTGGWGWGNQELEYYLNGPQNAFQAGGLLHLVALKGGVDKLDCWYGACAYSSARIKTKGKFAFTYGRVSARIKVPKGQGIWPAFWMLGSNIDSRNWPGCGEIDVMEVIGREPRTVHGTLHGPGYSGQQGLSSRWISARGEVGDDFHVFSVEWAPGRVRHSVDGEVFATRTPADLPPGETWVFDHDFFVLLNLAVGGTWPGNPDASTPFPAEMLVDWVRVEVRG